MLLGLIIKFEVSKQDRFTPFNRAVGISICMALALKNLAVETLTERIQNSCNKMGLSAGMSPKMSFFQSADIIQDTRSGNP